MFWKMENKKAVLIVSHGSRSQDAVDQFGQVVSMVQQNGHFPIVKGAHMELAQPDIPTVIKDLVDAGNTEIVVVPYFLFNGNHIKNDIPEILNGLKLLYPDVAFKFGDPIGFEPLMADILLKRAVEAERL
jgi:sirohydrochlorin cobaltochelatase